MDAGNMLKPMLARGELHCIGATPLDEYRQYIEKDQALERRFQPVMVDQPTVEDTISILRGIKDRYEVYHGVKITDSSLVAAATLSNRYITDRFLPDKAIDLVDEACAAFNAPLAGVMFSLEELQKNFNSSMLVCIISGCVTSDFISKNVFGLSPVFDFHLKAALPLVHYWMLVLLGILLGLCGAFYNFIMLKGQDLFGAMKKIPAKYRIVFPFVVSGIVCYTLPSILAGGHAMISLITGHTLLVSTMLLLLVAKFFFSAFCFGSGAPGGIFFPLLILGAYLGAIYGTLMIQASGIPSYYLVNFITISMAGFFTAIVRAPITGILLIAEMTGTFEHFLSLAVVCIISYLVAHLLKSEPIYESLLGRILAKNGFKESENADHKVLRGFAVGTGSIAAKQLVKDVPWPEHCLIVTLNRGDEEIIARGSTEIHAGDTIIALIDDSYLGMVTESIQLICGEIIPE